MVLGLGLVGTFPQRPLAGELVGRHLEKVGMEVNGNKSREMCIGPAATGGGS